MQPREQHAHTGGSTPSQELDDPWLHPAGDRTKTACEQLENDPLQHGTHIGQTIRDGDGKEDSGGVRC